MRARWLIGWRVVLRGAVVRLKQERVGTFAAGVRVGDRRCGEWRRVGLSRIRR